MAGMLGHIDFAMSVRAAQREGAELLSQSYGQRGLEPREFLPCPH